MGNNVSVRDDAALSENDVESEVWFDSDSEGLEESLTEEDIGNDGEPIEKDNEGVPAVSVALRA